MPWEGLRDYYLRYRGGLLVLAYGALFMGAVKAGHSAQGLACRVALLALALGAWAALLQRARLVSELALSRIASAAQGFVRISGTASGDAVNLVQCPYSGVLCVWYRYRLYSRNNSKGDWREIDRGVSSATFELKDDTGACRVDPDFAEVVGAQRSTRYEDGDKLEQELLLAGSTLHVFGEFSTIGGPNAPLNLHQDVSALLAQWKTDYATVLRRFDHDGDGQLNMQEWELARQQATKEVEEEHRVLREQPGIFMLKAPADGRPFVISALAPERTRWRYRIWALLHLAIAFLVLALWQQWIRNALL